LIAGFDFVRLVSNGDEVLVTYEGRRKNGESFRNTEIRTIRRSQIVSVEVYFGWSIPHEAPSGGYISKTEG
jgi:hypothetical protein